MHRAMAGGIALAAIAAALAGCQTAPAGRAALVTEPGCVDFSFQIYFDQQSAALTPAARTVIAQASSRLPACPPATVEIVGLADFRGPPEPNLALSRKRAEIVAAQLSKSGFAEPTFRVLAAGQAGAVTAGGEAEPLRRRAEVLIRFGRP